MFQKCIQMYRQWVSGICWRYFLVPLGNEKEKLANNLADNLQGKFPWSSRGKWSNSLYHPSIKGLENLEYYNIRENKGLIYISKVFLNSLFGKSGQRTDLRQSKIVKNPEAFLTLLVSPQFEVKTVVPVGKENLLVTYKDIESENKPLKFSNVVLAAIISSWARLRLYELL